MVACHPRTGDPLGSDVLRPCAGVPTAAGRDVLSRLRRGLHPKCGLAPPLVGAWRPADAPTAAALGAEHEAEHADEDPAGN